MRKKSVTPEAEEVCKREESSKTGSVFTWLDLCLARGRTRGRFVAVLVGFHWFFAICRPEPEQTVNYLQ